MQTVSVEGTVGWVEESDSLAATAKTRVNLALHHLFAACRFAARIRQIEKENEAQAFGEFCEEILHNALGVLTLATASLEAFANELYFEGEGLKSDLSPKAKEILAQLIDRESVLAKYELVLAIRSSHGLPYGETVIQDVQTLIQLRNSVIHFHPEWLGDDGQHAKLSKKLNHKFSPSPYFPGEGLFPRAWASGDFSGWALKTTINFFDFFCTQAHLENPCTKFRCRLSTYSDGVI
jgi:hypothetical protein